MCNSNCCGPLLAEQVTTPLALDVAREEEERRDVDPSKAIDVYMNCTEESVNVLAFSWNIR